MAIRKRSSNTSVLAYGNDGVFCTLGEPCKFGSKRRNAPFRNFIQNRAVRKHGHGFKKMITAVIWGCNLGLFVALLIDVVKVFHS